MKRVFLSSSFADLVPQRQAARLMLESLGYAVEAMEDFGSSERQPLNECLARVASSDLVICLLAASYGSLTPEGISFTEAEVRHARLSRVPILVYCMDENQPILTRHVSQGEAATRLAAFRQWLHENYTVSTFASPDDLGRKVIRDVQRLFRAVDVVASLRLRLDSTNDRDFDVLTFTAHNMDYVYEVDRIAADHESAVSNPVRSPGGSGANTVFALSLLGLRTAAAGIIADDADGLALRQSLEEAGVDVARLLTVRASRDAHSGRALVFSNRSNQRLIYVNPGVNERLELNLRKDANSGRSALDALKAARIIHMTSFTGSGERHLQTKLIQELDRNTLLSFTPGSIYARLGADRLKGILARANLLFLYEHQLDELVMNSSAAGLYSSNSDVSTKLATLFSWRKDIGANEPLVIVVKNPLRLARGEFSGYLSVGSGRNQLDSFIKPESPQLTRKEPVITDSTGAGDALAAGMIFGLVNDCTLTECADIAFVLALSAASAIGAREGLPARALLPERWRSILSSNNAPAWLEANVD